MKEQSNFIVKNADESSGFLLWQVTILWQKDIKKALEDIGINHTSFVILASLLWFEEQDIEITQTTIINHTKLDKMTVSKNLKSFVLKGFVERFENKNDTRAKTIILSSVGKEIAIKALKIVENIDISFFEKLKDDDKLLLNRLFIKLIK